MWNYRVATKFVHYSPKMIKTFKRKGDRVFGIVSCYYDKNKKPDSWGETNMKLLKKQNQP